MTESLTTPQLIDVIREGIPFSGGSVLEGAEGIEMIAEILEHTAHSDFVTVMVAKSAVPTEYEGVEGFREALNDWITPYEHFRLEMDEVVERGDKLVFLVRQVGITKHGGVEVITPSASVWSLLDGQIRQMTFYLDQHAGLAAAGIDPDEPR